MARQFVVPIALGCTAVFCTLAGSAFANWITVADHRPGAIGVPAGATLDAPAPVEERSSSQEEAVPGPGAAMDLYGNEVTDAVANRGRIREARWTRSTPPRRKCPA